MDNNYSIFIHKLEFQYLRFGIIEHPNTEKVELRISYRI